MCPQFFRMRAVVRPYHLPSILAPSSPPLVLPSLYYPLINQHRVVHALGTDRRTVEGVWEICKGW